MSRAAESMPRPGTDLRSCRAKRLMGALAGLRLQIGAEAALRVQAPSGQDSG